MVTVIATQCAADREKPYFGRSPAIPEFDVHEFLDRRIDLRCLRRASIRLEAIAYA